MPTTLLQVQKKIAELKAVEEKLRRQEAAGVAARIKEAIVAYGFTPEDLFDLEAEPDRALSVRVSEKKVKPIAKSKSKISQSPQYADDAGHQWVGRGPRPAWLRDALESGKSLADFAVSRAAKKKAKAAASTVALPTPPREQSLSVTASNAPKKRAIKYRDGDGNTWSGGGSQPRWLTAALASGQALEDFRVHPNP